MRWSPTSPDSGLVPDTLHWRRLPRGQPFDPQPSRRRFHLGGTTRDLLRELTSRDLSRYDAILICVGANDLLNRGQTRGAQPGAASDQ